MLQRSDIALANLSPRHPFREYLRRLVINGKELATVVPGDTIEALYPFGSVYLLVTSYDYYDGSSHWFSILDGEGRVIDRAHTPDYFGSITWLERPSQDCLTFSFFGTNDTWQVCVKSQGFWSFRLSDMLRRTNRYILSKRYMQFTCEKGAPWIFQANTSSTSDAALVEQPKDGPET